MVYGKIVELNRSHNRQVQGIFKLPSILNNIFHNYNKQRQLERLTDKYTVAPRRCPEMEIRTTNMEINIAAIETKGNETKTNLQFSAATFFCFHLRSLFRLYCWNVPFIKRRNKDFNDQQLHIRHVFG